ncbi:MAG: hypothetical protein Q8K02_08665 [Flavobacterium sp.]|nr:hypothetical protein [Flavobacterium sp.]
MRIIFFLSFFLTPFFFQAQEKFEVKEVGFSMNVPFEWIEVKNNEVLNNLDNFDFTKEQKSKLLTSSNSANELVTYYKYHPSKFNGIIPTVKVRTRSVNSKSIDEFLKVIELSNNEASKTLKNFKYQKEPELITVSGKQVVSFSVKFELSHNGKESNVVSSSYYVLKNGYFISINFIEELNKENNEIFFKELLSSIELK